MNSVVHIKEICILYRYRYTSICCCVVTKSNSFCDPIDCSTPGFSVHGITQEKNWSGLPFLSPGDLPNLGIEPGSPALLADSLLTELPVKQFHMAGFKCGVVESGGNTRREATVLWERTLIFSRAL